jgi:hypothetical protein
MYTDQSFAEASYPSLNRHTVKSPPICLYKNLGKVKHSTYLKRKYEYVTIVQCLLGRLHGTTARKEIHAFYIRWNCSNSHSLLANIGKASIYGTRREEGLRVRKLYRCMC